MFILHQKVQNKMFNLQNNVFKQNCILTGVRLCMTGEHYLNGLLQETRMAYSNGVHTPMASRRPLCLDSNCPEVDETMYHRVLGQLQYRSFTRPGISFSVNKFSLFMHCPKQSQSHWKAVKRLL